MDRDLVTIFGGSGFIGRYTAKSLVDAGYRVRVAVRNPHLSNDVRLAGPPGWIDVVQANVRNLRSIENAVSNATAVINLVGILHERGNQTFESTQLTGAKNIARACSRAGIQRLIQVSAIGADATSSNKYARTKGAAECAIRKAVPSAIVMRPSIVFGPEDEFFNRFASIAAHPISEFFPILPAIGGGKTRIQPVFAGNVAEALATALYNPKFAGKTFELGGPRTYCFKDIYKFICEETDRKRFSTTIPFFIAKPLGLCFGTVYRHFWPFSTGVLGAPPITGDQVEMLKSDNVVSETALTFSDLDIQALESIEVITPKYLSRYRPYGQYNRRRDRV